MSRENAHWWVQNWDVHLRQRETGMPHAHLMD